MVVAALLHRTAAGDRKRVDIIIVLNIYMVLEILVETSGAMFIRKLADGGMTRLLPETSSILTRSRSYFFFRCIL